MIWEFILYKSKNVQPVPTRKGGLRDSVYTPHQVIYFAESRSRSTTGGQLPIPIKQNPPNAKQATVYIQDYVAKL